MFLIQFLLFESYCLINIHKSYLPVFCNKDLINLKKLHYLDKTDDQIKIA